MRSPTLKNFHAERPMLRKIPYEKRKLFFGFLFTVPWLIGFIYFFLIPFIYAFIYSICKITITEHGMQYAFVGLKNYADTFTTDPRFIIGLPYVLQIMALQIPLIMVFSSFLSVLLNQKFQGRIFVRGIFFLPVIIASGVIINIMTTQSLATTMMSGQKSSALFQGIDFAQMLISFGLPLQIVTQIMSVINGVFQLVWKSGVQTLLLLAGLQSIPKAMYEAADVEGASAWERFWKVTMPILSPQLLLCFLYTIIDSSTDYSNVMIRYIRDLAQGLNFEKSSAISCVWFLIIMAIVGLVFLISRNRVYYMDDRG